MDLFWSCLAQQKAIGSDLEIHNTTAAFFFQMQSGVQHHSNRVFAINKTKMLLFSFLALTFLVHVNCKFSKTAVVSFVTTTLVLTFLECLL